MNTETKKINVKEIVQQKRAVIAEQVIQLKMKYNITPTFRVILVGENPASLSYIKGKMKAAETAGIDADVIKFPATITEEALLLEVEKLNQDDKIHGFIVQLPLPEHINENRLLEKIAFEKDIDGFHPEHIGRMLLGLPCFIPCTPKGIMEIMAAIDLDLAGKQVVVIGRSNIVGKPVAMLALQQDATVTICHSRTKDLPAIAKTADVLIVAIGREHFVNADFVKKGAIVIDVGVNKSSTTGKLVGDVDYEAVKDKIAAITPVPGGVGPMTITMLLQNTIEATCLQHNIEL